MLIGQDDDSKTKILLKKIILTFMFMKIKN